MKAISACLVAFVIINAAAFLSFWVDKVAARNGARRISESNLLALAFFGGSAGAVLAQQIFRHKTRKEPFRTRLMLIAGLHAAAYLMTGGYFLAMFLSNVASANS